MKRNVWSINVRTGGSLVALSEAASGEENENELLAGDQA